MHRMPGPVMKARMQRILDSRKWFEDFNALVHKIGMILNERAQAAAEGREFDDGPIVLDDEKPTTPARPFSLKDIVEEQMCGVAPAFRKFHRNRYW